MPEWYFGSALNPPEVLIKPEDNWIFQWERVKRYYARANKLKEKNEHEELSDCDIDDIISFFMNAFHLKDWIRSCHVELINDLEQLFSKFEMGCCRDIANGYKHKKLARPSIEANFNLLREYDYDAEADRKNPVRYEIAFWDESNKKLRRWGILELVDIVYGCWDNFIPKNLKKTLVKKKLSK